MRVVRSITINKPPDEVYTLWHDFENLPRFMHHLASVEVTDVGRSHWVARAPTNATVEWDAEIVEDRPGQLISWRSVPNSGVQNSGSVSFRPGPQGKGTEITVELEYTPPAGAVGAAVAKLFGEEPTQQLRDDLRRFKQVAETGEVVRSEASPAGPGTSFREQRPAHPETEARA